MQTFSLIRENQQYFDSVGITTFKLEPHAPVSRNPEISAIVPLDLFGTSYDYKMAGKKTASFLQNQSRWFRTSLPKYQAILNREHLFLWHKHFRDKRRVEEMKKRLSQPWTIEEERELPFDPNMLEHNVFQKRPNLCFKSEKMYKLRVKIYYNTLPIS
ncbi:MAG: hypothetical protein AB1393_12470 [Candidatus Edwardsbacteria bacterium]